MKKKYILLIASLTIAALVIAAYGAAQNKQPARTQRLITVLNPAVASKMAQRIPLAPRLDTLEGKTIYMVAINWGGPEAAMSIFEEMQAWFAKNMPSVKTVIKIKKGGYETDDPALWKEISEKSNAVIMGVSG
jgi:hypothetical protein